MLSAELYAMRLALALDYHVFKRITTAKLDDSATETMDDQLWMKAGVHKKVSCNCNIA